MSVRVEAGDCREVIPRLGVSVDAIVCDPPYDLVAMTKRFGSGHAAAKSPDHQRFARGFMGKEWDGQGIAFDPETWRIIGSVYGAEPKNQRYERGDPEPMERPEHPDKEKARLASEYRWRRKQAAHAWRGPR